MEIKNEKTKKSKKRIIDTINIILYLSIFSGFIVPIQHLIWIISDLTFDISKYKEFGAYIILALFAFICKKIVEKGTPLSGITGIIFGVVMVLLFGYVWKLLGVLMIIDSILFLINYNKKENN